MEVEYKRRKGRKRMPRSIHYSCLNFSQCVFISFARHVKVQSKIAQHGSGKTFISTLVLILQPQHLFAFFPHLLFKLSRSSSILLRKI